MQCLQLFLFFFFKSQRTQGHITLYLLTTVPSAFLTFQLYSMAASRYSATGALISAGDDLSQPGLTQYMMDIVFVTWAAQVLACVWTRAWWIYASVRQSPSKHVLFDYLASSDLVISFILDFFHT